MNTKPNNTWNVTRTVDAGGERHVTTVGQFEGSNAKAALILASRLGGVATYKGTETRGEFRWGDVCYRATPCAPKPDPVAEKATQDARDRAALAVFFPPLRR